MSISNTKTFTQPGHPFTGPPLLEPVYFNGSLWLFAQANLDTTLCEGLIDAVAGDDITIYTPGGHFWTVPGHGKGPPGELLFLSAASPGVLVTAEPASGYGQQIGQVIDVDTLAIQSLPVYEIPTP